jgi:ketosteroid isomerase-like protein
MLADDAVIMVPNRPVQEGKTACARFVADVMAGLLEQFDRHIIYVSAEVRVIGDCGFDRGSFTFTVAPRSGGESSRENGKYLFLYSRAVDGSWKIARAIVNLDDHDGDEAAQ